MNAPELQLAEEGDVAQGRPQGLPLSASQRSALRRRAPRTRRGRPTAARRPCSRSRPSRSRRRPSGCGRTARAARVRTASTPRTGSARRSSRASTPPRTSPARRTRSTSAAFGPKNSTRLRDDGVATLVGRHPVERAGVLALEEREQHAGRARRRRVVEDDLHRALVAGGLAGEAVGPPERRVVDHVALDHRTGRHPLGELVAVRRAAAGRRSIRPASTGGIATIACRAVTSTPSARTVTTSPRCSMRRTGAPSRTTSGAELLGHARSGTSCEPPT